MTTFSGANINPLHRQRVKGREVVVTEEPRLHLPLPRYLLSHAFWKTFLEEGSNQAATGFLRTYRYLVQHESDFHIAQQDNLRLIPKDIEWPSFCRFILELSYIDDTVVSKRYCYGELRLTRLNLYAPLLLRKFHFEQVHGQYGDFFGRLYGPILFAFVSLVAAAIISSWFILLWLWMFLDEWIYTIKQKLAKSREVQGTPC
ncbi:hypothetical protein PSPO01_16137 [Paraphaeosphaeria sporulosa]